MPRVTVLMPLYNGIDYIEESLQSIQDQTFTDWEFIIVNDFGSDDGCAEVVKRYAKDDPRIKLVQMEERVGLASSLNVGLDMAQGEYVARVDCDDPSEPNRLEKQVAFMDAHPELSLCSCYCNNLSNGGIYLETVHCEPEELKAALLFPNDIHPFAFMLRKSFFDEHHLRYDTNSIVEDYELWTRALKEGAVFANIPEILVTHRSGFDNRSEELERQFEETSRKISADVLERLGVETWKYYPEFLSDWRTYPKLFAKNYKEIYLQQGYDLLKEIYECNATAQYCEQTALKKVLLERWNWLRKSCGLEYTPDFWKLIYSADNLPRISVVMPSFNSAESISMAIDSILQQTFTNWELLVINDLGSDDGTAEIVQMYAWADPRIRLIQAVERLGLAESLNLGIREAKGEYIARMDADDTSLPVRFERQIQYLDEHPDVGICGAWQHHYNQEKDWIHRAAPDPEVQKCRLLFWCDLCHSTLMLRRSVFIENHLFYNSSAKAEDYELWTRAVQFMDISNIPEVLGEYDEVSGITENKKNFLNEESGQISGRFIKRVLDINLSRFDRFLLNSWKNPISQNEPDRTEHLSRLREILTEIYEKNRTVGFFESKSLIEVLAAKWFWAKDNIDWQVTDYSWVNSLEDAFVENCEKQIRKSDPFYALEPEQLSDDASRDCQDEKSGLDHGADLSADIPDAFVIPDLEQKFDKQPLAVEPEDMQYDDRVSDLVSEDTKFYGQTSEPVFSNRNRVKHLFARMLSPVLYPFRKMIKVLMRDTLIEIDKRIENWTWDRYERTNEDIKNWTWNRYERTNEDIKNWTWNRYERTNEDIKNWTWNRYERTNEDIKNWTWNRYERTNEDIKNWTWDRYERTNEDIKNWTWDRYERTNKDIERWTWNRYERTNKDIERWTWDRYLREQNELEKLETRTNYARRKFRPCKKGSEIKIGILFQIPSCWASLETVWDVLKEDDRFAVTMYLFDEEQREVAQMSGARQFLIDHDIPFETVERYTFSDAKLDVLIYQTPYDEWHRPDWLQSNKIQSLGTRVVYIPYGLHYSMSVWKDIVFSEQKFLDIPWRIFLPTEHLRYDLSCCTNIPLSAVEACGHPKFDAIAHKERYPLEPDLAARIGNRKIVFIQMHFPQKEGNPSIPEPNISVYTEFLRNADYYKEFFFLVRPHPKMYEDYTKLNMQNEVEEFDAVINENENIFNYQFADYRPALFASDYIVGDRSTLMIEAGALNVPILYMTNYYYKERMLPFVAPLFDSYYQGFSEYDIRHFLDMVAIKGIDYKKEQREAAAKLCLPQVDGNTGRRIVDAIATAVYEEGESYA